MIKTEFVENYRCYIITKYTSEAGDVIYNGTSDYVRDGFVSVAGKTREEVILCINNVYKRMQMINLCKRMSKHRKYK